MLIGAYQSALILAVVVVFYAGDFWLIHRYDPLRTVGSSRSWGYTIMAMVAVVFFVAQPIAWPWLEVYTDAWWGLLVQVLGLVLVLSALALH